MRSHLTAALGVVLFSCAFAAPIAQAYNDTNADGSINVGNDKIFTVFARGGLNVYDNNITGPSIVQGNVGIGGHGNFSMSDGTIKGDLYMNDYGTFSISGPAKITGTKRGLQFGNGSQQSTLDSADASVNDTAGLSYAAAHESRTYNYKFNGTQATTSKYLSDVNTGQSMTVSITSGTKVVLNLQNFVMTSGTFTLQGTAMTTYIINVTNNFSLNNSKIVLSGGLLASHVLFNVIGTGSQVSLNQGTSMQGIMLAYNRKLDLSGGKIYGRAIANQVVITSGGQVVSQ